MIAIDKTAENVQKFGKKFTFWRKNDAKWGNL